MTSLTRVGTLTTCASGALDLPGVLLTGDKPEWLTSQQVADILGAHRSNVYRTSRERLPYRLTIGGQRRYSREVVTALKERLDSGESLTQESGDANH